MKREWKHLTFSDQKTYIERAAYLIDKGYVMDTDSETLAKKMFAAEEPEPESATLFTKLGD